MHCIWGAVRFAILRKGVDKISEPLSFCLHGLRYVVFAQIDVNCKAIPHKHQGSHKAFAQAARFPVPQVLLRVLSGVVGGGFKIRDLDLLQQLWKCKMGWRFQFALFHFHADDRNKNNHFIPLVNFRSSYRV